MRASKLQTEIDTKDHALLSLRETNREQLDTANRQLQEARQQCKKVVKELRVEIMMLNCQIADEGDELKELRQENLTLSTRVSELEETVKTSNLCPKGHHLKKFNTSDSYMKTCDGCFDTLPQDPNNVMWGCSDCNWNVCSLKCNQSDSCSNARLRLAKELDKKKAIEFTENGKIYRLVYITDKPVTRYDNVAVFQYNPSVSNEVVDIRSFVYSRSYRILTSNIRWKEVRTNEQIMLNAYHRRGATGFKIVHVDDQDWDLVDDVQGDFQVSEVPDI